MMEQFNPGSSGNAIGAAVLWLEGSLLGTVATTIPVIAVASVGFLLLSGRIDLKRGAQVIIGCFILFGASTIAAGIVRMTSGMTPEQPDAIAPPAPVPPIASGANSQPFDPYAGAALPSHR